MVEGGGLNDIFTGKNFREFRTRHFHTCQTFEGIVFIKPLRNRYLKQKFIFFLLKLLESMGQGTVLESLLFLGSPDSRLHIHDISVNSTLISLILAITVAFSFNSSN